MNYRHVFHAGNFADVMKHALLARLIGYLANKDTPFRVIDTHAGIGLYPLDSEEATRTGEWQDGVGRLTEPFPQEIETILAPYRRVLAEISTRYGEMVYPGSPAIIREMLRRQDRAVFVELHPEDFVLLNSRFNMVANIKVLHLDGWNALRALVPPRENRGLVLIDPPFEETGELEKMGDELLKAVGKWRNGVYAAWYPLKDRHLIERWAQRLDATLTRPALRLELLVDDTGDSTRLNGCGLVIVNPPWTLKAEAEILLPALAQRLGRNGKGTCLCKTLGPAP